MARLSRAWAAIRELSWRDRGLLARAWCLLFLASPGLRVFGFRRTRAALEAKADRPAGREDVTEARSIALAARRAAAWHPLRPNCLARSLVLVRLLRLRGLAADLRIGVAKPGEALAAHAWIEHGGVALAEADTMLRTYAPFDEAVLTR